MVHGHDTVAREQLELALHKLKLDPFVLANTGDGGLTIIEALEKEIGPRPGRTRFGIVLLTPDDMGYAKANGDGKAEPRARQNVVLEMGMLISALGRPNVAILKKGHIEIPSDAPRYPLYSLQRSHSRGRSSFSRSVASGWLRIRCGMHYSCVFVRTAPGTDSHPPAILLCSLIEGLKGR